MARPLFGISQQLVRNLKMLKASKKQVLVLIGALLIAAPLSLLSYYGNLLPYLASYYHAREDQVSINVPMLWPSSLFRCTFTAFMIVTSPLELKIGLRPCIVAGLTLLWLSLVGSYFAVEEPLALTLIFGGAQGFGCGIIYPLV